MSEIQVGATPVDLGAALSLGTGGSVSFFRIQNRGAGDGLSDCCRDISGPFRRPWFSASSGINLARPYRCRSCRAHLDMERQRDRDGSD